MVQCPKCGMCTAEFRREHKHGEYVTVGFCSSCGYTWYDKTEREKDLECIEQFKNQMSSVRDDIITINKPLMTAEGLSSKQMCGLILAIGLGGSLCLLGFPLLTLTLSNALQYGTSIDGVGYVVVGIVSVIIGVMIYLQGRAEAKVHKQHVVNYNKKLLQQKEISRQRIEESYKNSNQFIPFIYIEPMTVEIIESYLRNKQVSNLGEAINKIETDRRYQQQMQIQLNQLRAMFMQADAQYAQAQAQRNCANAQSRTADNISNLNDTIKYSNTRF